MSQTLSVIGFGMVTCLGFNGQASCAAMQAGIRGIRRGNLWDPTVGEYIDLGRPELPQWWEGPGCLAEEVAPAISECLTLASELTELGRPISVDTIPILILISPPDRPARWPNLDSEVLAGVGHKLGRPLPKGSQAVPLGRTGMVEALRKAMHLIYAEGHRLCVVAGVESFLRQAIALHYLEAGRILSGANSNGFSPGEAGAAVLLAPSGWYRGPELVIEGMDIAQDPSGAGGDPAHPVTGNGLTTAIRSALKAAGKEFWAIDLRLSDANGEHFKFKEIAFSNPRLERPRPAGVPPRRFGHLDHWHPIENVGEVGAALFPLLLGFALDAGVNRYAHGPCMLLHTGEDSGERAALLASFRINSRGRGVRQ